jgi:hypothetical protein
MRYEDSLVFLFMPVEYRLKRVLLSKPLMFDVAFAGTYSFVTE